MMSPHESPTLPWRLCWDPSLSVGIEDIDREHEAFMGLINAFNTALLDRAELPILGQHLDAIIEDAQTHFAYEEQLFEEHGYEKLEKHRAEHSRLLQEIGHLRGEFDSGLSEAKKIRLGMELRDLLVDHLLNFDMLYRGKLT